MRRLILATVITFGTVAGPFTTTTAEAAGRCPKYEALLRRHAPAGGWSVSRMSALMYRESRCLPHVQSRTSDTGLLQINKVNFPYLRRAMKEWVDRTTLQQPSQNIRAAARLCEFWRRAGKSCYQPWSL